MCAILFLYRNTEMKALDLRTYEGVSQAFEALGLRALNLGRCEKDVMAPFYENV